MRSIIELLIFLTFLNAAVGGVLVLVVRFTLEISNGIHTKNLMDSMANLSLGVVTEQGGGGTVEAAEIF